MPVSYLAVSFLLLLSVRLINHLQLLYELRPRPEKPILNEPQSLFRVISLHRTAASHMGNRALATCGERGKVPPKF